MSYWVYILANKRNGTLYVGVTNDVVRRISEHKGRVGAAFTRKYGVSRLVRIEEYVHVEDAIRREKQLKRWRRKWKLDLIERGNPDWRDLFDTINA